MEAVAETSEEMMDRYFAGEDILRRGDPGCTAQ